MNPEQNPVETLVNEVSAYSDGLNDEKKNTQDAKPEERSKTLVARSLRLAQDIIDEGYLKCLVAVRPDRYNPNNRVYIFEHNDIVAAMINEYIVQRRAQKDNRPKRD